MLSRLTASALISLAALAGPAGAAAPRPLTGEERTGMRCAAAFAQLAARQAKGDAAALRYPPMVPRGREFFVRLSAQLMDDAGLDEAGIRAAVEGEARDLARSGGVDPIMPLCLRILNAQPGLGG